MRDGLSSVIAELRRQLMAIYGKRLVRLVLFGSQARGQAEAGSDIDLLVVLQGPVKPGEGIARAEEFLEPAKQLIKGGASPAQSQ